MSRLVRTRTVASLLAIVAVASASPLASPWPAATASRHHLVVCAPGYPGSTSQAQPTMDAFAAMVETAVGWTEGTLTAEYHEDRSRGLAGLGDPGTDLALVPLPLFLEHELSLQLSPLVQVVPRDQIPSETWSLVAARGRVASAADLSGWQIAGVPAYSPGFVRGPALAHWGVVPQDVEITFNRGVLSALRRAMAGEQVAVLLDRAQTEALARLPNADSLEVITSSPELPAALVVVVGGRLEQADVDRLAAALLGLHEQSRFADVLDTLRLSRFGPLNAEALNRARAVFGGS